MTRIHAFRNDFIEFKLSEMFNLKNVDVQPTNVLFLTFKNLNEIAIDIFLLQILLFFKFKIIKFEKIKIYKS